MEVRPVEPVEASAAAATVGEIEAGVADGVDLAVVRTRMRRRNGNL